MNLYKVVHLQAKGDDVYDSMVVRAASAQEAKELHPSHYGAFLVDNKWWVHHAARGNESIDGDNWPRYVDRDILDVVLLGKADSAPGVVLTSFNAG